MIASARRRRRVAGRRRFGERITAGLALNDGPTMLAGAIPAAALALLVQALDGLARVAIRPGATAADRPAPDPPMLIDPPPDTPTLLLEAPTVIDVEASGFGKGSYPIEVGFVLPDGRGDCMLIRPGPQWRHWDVAAERLHHISRALLEERGRPARDVAERLNAQLARTHRLHRRLGARLHVAVDLCTRPPAARRRTASTTCSGS